MQRKSIERTLEEISKFHFILDEGRKGNHLLFKPQIIRDVFSKEPKELSENFEKQIDQINVVLNETFTKQSFAEKQSYIESLSPELQSALVFGYFQLLENGESGSDVVRHILH